MKHLLKILTVFAAIAWGTAVFASPVVWGIHTHSPVHIPAAAASGYGAIRFWDTRTTWADVEPARNSFQLIRFATALKASEQGHLKVLWTLGSTPQWASARPTEKCPYGLGCGAEPENLNDWRHYVATIASTYKGRIECYEPWNEVSFPHDSSFDEAGSGGDPEGFFSGSVASMVSIARAAYEQVKQADSQACVTTPSFHNSGNMVEKLDRYLAAGGGRYADALSMHFYFSDEPEEVVSTIRAVQKTRAKYGLARLPIWNTEVGVEFSRKAGERPLLSRDQLAYAMIVRSGLINAAEGIDRIYWYAWDNGNFGFFDRNNGQDFGTAAATAAVHLFSGIEKVNCRQTESLWKCRASGSGRRFKAIWLSGKNAKPRYFQLDAPATRWDRAPEFFHPGQQIEIDGRPVIIEEQS